MRGREMAYDQGWLRTKRLPQPTICVGNIINGGTGKTLLVMKLARDLQARGLRPGILLRGYKRVRASAHPALVRDTERICVPVEACGDEAMELALRLPGSFYRRRRQSLCRRNVFIEAGPNRLLYHGRRISTSRAGAILIL